MDLAQKQKKLDHIINATSIREVRVSKTMVSPKTGNSHTVELVAEVEEKDIPSALIATHILALKAETTVMLHLSQSDNVPKEERIKRIDSLKSSYSILIASELENI